MAILELIMMGIFFSPLIFVIAKGFLDQIEGNKKPP